MDLDGRRCRLARRCRRRTLASTLMSKRKPPGRGSSGTVVQRSKPAEREERPRKKPPRRSQPRAKPAPQATAVAPAAPRRSAPTPDSDRSRRSPLADAARRGQFVAPVDGQAAQPPRSPTQIAVGEHRSRPRAASRSSPSGRARAPTRRGPRHRRERGRRRHRSDERPRTPAIDGRRPRPTEAARRSRTPSTAPTRPASRTATATEHRR